jgi:hypothetical protein
MAAATLGAGWYISSTPNAFANTRSDIDINAKIEASFAQTVVEKDPPPPPIATRFPERDLKFAAVTPASDANPTFAFAIPERAQRAAFDSDSSTGALRAKPAPPKLASVAMYNPKAGDDARPPRTGTQLASLGPPGELNVDPQEDARATRTAIYDITAQALYMPNGEKLEAHSGFGDFMDNPKHVHLRMRGATPPNTYRLTMREKLFHGVEAVRMNPEDDGAMMGRAGILVHPYMLGPTGQSNGCISLKEYGKFLASFKRGEVARIVVVSRLDQPPAHYAGGVLHKWIAWLPKIF